MYVSMCMSVSVCVLKIIKVEREFWKATFPASLLYKYRKEIREIYTSPELQSPFGDLGLALDQTVSVNNLLLPLGSLSSRQEKVLA